MSEAMISILVVLLFEIRYQGLDLCIICECVQLKQISVYAANNTALEHNSKITLLFGAV